MERIIENKTFLNALVEARKASDQIRIIRQATDENLKCLVEIMLNLNLILDKEEKASFRKQIAAVKPILKNRKLCLKYARKTLIKAIPFFVSILTHIIFKLYTLSTQQ